MEGVAPQQAVPRLHVLRVEGGAHALVATDRVEQPRHHRPGQRDQRREQPAAPQGGRDHERQAQQAQEQNQRQPRPQRHAEAEPGGHHRQGLAHGDAGLPQQRLQVELRAAYVLQDQRLARPDGPELDGDRAHHPVQRPLPHGDAGDLVVGEVPHAGGEELVGAAHRAGLHLEGGAEGPDAGLQARHEPDRDQREQEGAGQQVGKNGAQPVHLQLGGPRLRGRHARRHRRPRSRVRVHLGRQRRVLLVLLPIAGPPVLEGLRELVHRLRQGRAVAQASELHLGAAALAADADVVQAQDLVDQGALRGAVGQVLGREEGVLAGEEALGVDDGVVVHPVGAAAHVQEVERQADEAGDGDRHAGEHRHDREAAAGEHLPQHLGGGEHQGQHGEEGDADALDDHAHQVGLLLVQQLGLAQGEAVAPHQVRQVLVDPLGLHHVAQDDLAVAAAGRLDHHVTHLEQRVARPGQAQLDLGDVAHVQLGGLVAEQPAPSGHQPVGQDPVGLLAVGDAGGLHGQRRQGQPDDQDQGDGGRPDEGGGGSASGDDQPQQDHRDDQPQDDEGRLLRAQLALGSGLRHVDSDVEHASSVRSRERSTGARRSSPEAVYEGGTGGCPGSPNRLEPPAPGQAWRAGPEAPWTRPVPCCSRRRSP